MSRLARTRGRLLLVALALATLLVAGASAYWSGSGSGTTTTLLPSPNPLTFSLGTPTADLYPGGAASVSIIARNSNSYFLHVGAMELATDQGATFAVDGAHSGCDVSVLSFVRQDNGGNGWSVPPKVASTDGTLNMDLANAVQMGASAANACQGATFTVRLVARG
jgi:hypothetical protein